MNGERVATCFLFHTLPNLLNVKDKRKYTEYKEFALISLDRTLSAVVGFPIFISTQIIGVNLPGSHMFPVSDWCEMGV